MKRATDINGTPVHVGIRVRVVSVRASVLRPLSEAERRRVKSMIGEILTVDGIDAYGSAWVTKWWHHRGGKSTSHSLALGPAEMEVVPSASPTAA